MFHRFSTWWRALGVVLLSLATVTWPSASWASPTAPFSLTHQDASTTLVAGSATVHFGVTLPAGASLSLALFPSLVDRGQLAPLIEGSGDPVSPLATVSVISPSCRPNPHRLTLNILAAGTARSGHCGAPAIHLPCSAASCAGVYPLRYSVRVDGRVYSTWSMIGLQSGAVPTPLRVVVLANLDATSWQDTSASIATLRAITAFPTTPLAITANYSPLASSEIAGTTLATTWRHALSQSLQSPEHQAIIAPPSTTDFGGLAASGFQGEVAQQLDLGNTLLRALTGRFPSGPVWVSGPVTANDLRALVHAGVTQAIVDDSALTPAPSGTLLWGAPEHIAGVAGLTTLATDDPLSTLANDATIPAALRAVLAINTLSFLHFDAPNDPSPRTEIVALSVATAGAAFVHDFLAGLNASPFARPSSIAPSYASSLVGSNGIPSEWDLATTSVTPWTTQNIRSLSTLLAQEHAFVQGVANPGVVAALNAAVAEAEVKGSASQRQLDLTTAQSLLNEQLNNFRIDNSSITLTGQGTALPITLVSHAHYSVTVLVHLLSNSLRFAKGPVVAATLSQPTTALRVALEHASGTNVTLQIVVTTPNGRLVLARTAVQVRIAGTSIVGYLLSALSLTVLGVWWLRTYRRSSKGKHAK